MDIKIGVIGLGLIGGSIFKNLSPKYDVTGISRSVKGEKISDDYNLLKDCNVVFVCTPMNITLEILDKLENYVSADTVVTDVCSLKGFVSKKKYKYCFIPSHPMAGTENSGWESSFSELFEGANWVITPIDGEIDSKQEILEKIIKSMGAKIVITNAEEHDKAAALISHMPLVIAQALCANIKDEKLAQIIASSGFRDTTRLALSNTEMADDMVNFNKENIKYALGELNKNIDELMSGDYKTLAEKIKAFRQRLYS